MIQLLTNAIKSQTPITATYKNRVRTFCPHIVGTKDGKHKSLMLQIAGSSKHGLDTDASNNWRCVFIQELSSVSLAVDEHWQTPDNWDADLQTCVDVVFASI